MRRQRVGEAQMLEVRTILYMFFGFLELGVEAKMLQ